MLLLLVSERLVIHRNPMFPEGHLVTRGFGQWGSMNKRHFGESCQNTHVCVCVCVLHSDFETILLMVRKSHWHFEKIFVNHGIYSTMDKPTNLNWWVEARISSEIRIGVQVWFRWHSGTLKNAPVFWLVSLPKTRHKEKTSSVDVAYTVSTLQSRCSTNNPTFTK